ncbi:MAG: hypothetical protein M1834_007224 [Cirrosporium novae-zelandiae]|nr:MAG: hypothetical protein M1834_007224 [Cirrosporium novae-zelandiae]
MKRELEGSDEPARKKSRTSSPESTAEFGFSIRYGTRKDQGKKRHGETTARLEDSDFPENTRMVYSISPGARWDEMTKYNNFIVGEGEYSQKIGFGDWVYINKGNIPPGDIFDNAPTQSDAWVARVLEVRASDPKHVYIRIFQSYWPEELPDGKRYYQGKHEILPSNYMEIIDAATIMGKANVIHFTEKDDDEIVLETLYWRQTYDFVKKTFSDIRTHCVCSRHYNPDKILIGCSNPSCRIWLHDDCLEHSILSSVYKRLVLDSESPNKNPEGDSTNPDEGNSSYGQLSPPMSTSPIPTAANRPKKRGRKPKAIMKGRENTTSNPKWTGLFSATIHLNRGSDEPPTVTINDLRTENAVSWVEDLRCLKCNEMIV